MMAEGRGKSDWQHTSSILAMLVNTHRADRKVSHPRDFDPYTPRTVVKMPISILKDLFVK